MFFSLGLKGERQSSSTKEYQNEKLFRTQQMPVFYKTEKSSKVGRFLFIYFFTPFLEVFSIYFIRGVHSWEGKLEYLVGLG